MHMLVILGCIDYSLEETHSNISNSSNEDTPIKYVSKNCPVY